jgi:hypothetical protein
MAENIPTYPDLAGKVALVSGGLEASRNGWDKRRRAPQSGRPPVLYFRALLTEGGDPRVQLHRA